MQCERMLQRSRFEKYSIERKLPKDAKPAPDKYVSGRLRRKRNRRLNEALHDAAKMCDLPAMRSSVKKGAQMNSVICGMTPLNRALSHGSYDLQGAVEYLLKKGANPNVANERGWSPLIAAAFSGKAWHVKLLLEHGADPKQTDAYGETALDVAVKNRKYEAAQLIIKHAGRSPPLTKSCALENEVDEVMSRRMLSAVRDEDMTAITRLLDIGVEIDLENHLGTTALMAAVDECKDDTIAFLLERGADPNATDRMGLTPLIKAIFNGRADHVRLLLKHGADPAWCAENCASPLRIAVNDGKFGIAQLLVSGMGKGPTQTSPEEEKLAEVVRNRMIDRLIWATCKKDMDGVQQLLELGVDINRGNYSGVTALMAAIMENDQGMVGFLLENGADPKARDNRGWSSLEYAVEFGFEQMYEHLIGKRITG